MTDKPNLRAVQQDEAHEPIQKPSAFDLNKFKCKHAVTSAGVETLQTALPHHTIAQAKDFVRCTRTKTSIGRPSCAS